MSRKEVINLKYLQYFGKSKTIELIQENIEFHCRQYFFNNGSVHQVKV